MPSMECQVCAGSGYVQEDGATAIICRRCEGTGVVIVDESGGDTIGDATG